MNKYNVTSVRCVHSVGARLFDRVRGKLLQIFPNVNFIGRGLGNHDMQNIFLKYPEIICDKSMNYFRHIRSRTRDSIFQKLS